MKYIFIVLFLFSTVLSHTQTVREIIEADPTKSASVYVAYPKINEHYTPAPKEYTPFYLSHYGRHGSRYLISDNDYLSIISILDKANAIGFLSDKGKDVRLRLHKVWNEAQGLGGELTPLGYRQHRDIAHRMYKNFPTIFKGKRSIYARSTVVIRCALSMATCCETLKGLNPDLSIDMGAGKRYMKFLNYWNEVARKFTSNESEWRTNFNEFKNKRIQPNRLMNLLFTNKAYVKQHINSEELMTALYWLASDMQNTESEISFYDLFTPNELYNLWEIANYNHYVCNGTCPWGKEDVQQTFIPLLEDILDSANQAINNDSLAATLRFGHDGILMPLTGLLQLEGCSNEVNDPNLFAEAWHDFQISPMAGNVQIIFFRKKGSDDILVKFLLNEKEVEIPVDSDLKPYYHWNDVEKFYNSYLNKLRLKFNINK